MREYMRFWWKCIRTAVIGSISFANDWQWLVGIPLVALLLHFAAVKLKNSQVTIGNPIIDAVITAGFAFAITWIAGFLLRLTNAPVALNANLRTLVEELEQRLHAGAPLFDAAKKNDGLDLARTIKIELVHGLGGVAGEHRERWEIRLEKQQGIQRDIYDLSAWISDIYSPWSSDKIERPKGFDDSFGSGGKIPLPCVGTDPTLYDWLDFEFLSHAVPEGVQELEIDHHLPDRFPTFLHPSSLMMICFDVLVTCPGAKPITRRFTAEFQENTESHWDVK